MKPFDKNDLRCVYPRYGEQIDRAMQAAGYGPTDVANHLGVHPSIPAAWRRGHARNPEKLTPALEALLGVKLDMTEPSLAKRATAQRQSSRTSAKTSAPVSPSSSPADLAIKVLRLLGAAAEELGYDAVFTPVGASAAKRPAATTPTTSVLPARKKGRSR